MTTVAPSKRWAICALAGVLVASGLLYFENLGSPHITVWDESVHAVVVQNLAHDCCVPRLHRVEGLGLDWTDWTSNTVWLHKPVLPFYASAASYALFGHSLWAMRLPGAVAALLIVLMTGWLGNRYSSAWAGAIAAALVGLNPYTNELVHGRSFSGFPDLEMAFFLMVSLWAILQWQRCRSSGLVFVFGAAVGMAYLCKGGLALAPLAAVLALVVFARGRRAWIVWLAAPLLVVAVALPVALYWLHRFPAEFRFENREQLLHLTQSIDEWGAPWYTYFAKYVPALLTPSLTLVAYSALGWGLRGWRKKTPAFTLCLWILAYLIPLSFAVSKIENFIYPTLPAFALLIGAMLDSLWRSQQSRAIVLFAGSTCAASLAGMVLWNSGHWFKWTLVSAVAIAALSVPLCLFLPVPSRRVTKATALVAVASFVSLCVATEHRSNGVGDAPNETVLRASGLAMRGHVSQNALVLAPGTWHELGNLILMYWSGADVLDVCRVPDPAATLEKALERQDVYLLVNAKLPLATAIELPAGNLYDLSGQQPVDWREVVEQDCKANRLRSSKTR